MEQIINGAGAKISLKKCGSVTFHIIAKQSPLNCTLTAVVDYELF